MLSQKEAVVCLLVTFQAFWYLDGVRYGGVWAFQLTLLGAKRTEPGGSALGWTSYLPSDGVRAADHGCLQDGGVLSKGTLHFHGPDPVAGREKATLPSDLPSPHEASKGEGKSRQLDLEELITSSFLPMNQK